jgi:hypothetical protein
MMGATLGRFLAVVFGPMAVIVLVMAGVLWRLNVPDHTVAAGCVALAVTWLVYVMARPARGAAVGAIVIGLVIGALVYPPPGPARAGSGVDKAGTTAQSGLQTVVRTVRGWLR